MKTPINIVLLSFFFLAFFACDKTIVEPEKEKEEEEENICDFHDDNLGFYSFFTFDPKTYPETTAAIALTVDTIHYTNTNKNHSVIWEDGFTDFAKSLKYNDLPISATVTQISTGCKASITLEKSFFD